MWLALFSLDKQGTRNEELKQADAVVLTYDCEERATFERLSSYWLPELRRLEVGVWISFFEGTEEI